MIKQNGFVCKEGHVRKTDLSLQGWEIKDCPNQRFCYLQVKRPLESSSGRETLEVRQNSQRITAGKTTQCSAVGEQKAVSFYPVFSYLKTTNKPTNPNLSNEQKPQKCATKPMGKYTSGILLERDAMQLLSFFHFCRSTDRIKNLQNRYLNRYKGVLSPVRLF